MMYGGHSYLAMKSVKYSFILKSPMCLYTGTQQFERDPGLIPCRTLATQEDKSGNHTAH